MYKINYYTLAWNADGSLGNIEQFRDIGYTEFPIEDIPTQLKEYIDNKYGKGKYEIRITNIEAIQGKVIDNKYYTEQKSKN